MIPSQTFALFALFAAYWIHTASRVWLSGSQAMSPMPPGVWYATAFTLTAGPKGMPCEFMIRKKMNPGPGSSQDAAKLSVPVRGIIRKFLANTFDSPIGKLLAGPDG